MFLSKIQISKIPNFVWTHRKKQEFSGSIIDTDEIKCVNYSKVFEVDAHSIISKKCNF